MQSVFTCEIRNLKGEPVLAPEGGRWLVRARFPADQLPEAYKSLRAELSLRASATVLTAAGDAEDGVTPAQGVPEELTGVVLEHLTDSRLLLDLGMLVEIDVPQGAAMPALGTRVCCALEGELQVVTLSLT